MSFIPYIFAFFILIQSSLVLAGKGGITGNPGNPNSNIAAGKSTKALKEDALEESATKTIQALSTSDGMVKRNITFGNTTIEVSVDKTYGIITLTQLTPTSENQLPIEIAELQSSISVGKDGKIQGSIHILPFNNGKSVFVSIGANGMMIDLTANKKSRIFNFENQDIFSPISVFSSENDQETLVIASQTKLYFLETLNEELYTSGEYIFGNTAEIKGITLEKSREGHEVIQIVANSKIREGTSEVYLLQTNPIRSPDLYPIIDWMEKALPLDYKSVLISTLSEYHETYSKREHNYSRFEITLFFLLGHLIDRVYPNPLSHVEQPLIGEPFIIKDSFEAKFVIARTKDHFFAIKNLGDEISYTFHVQPISNYNDQRVLRLSPSLEADLRLAILSTSDGKIYIVNNRNYLGSTLTTIHIFNPSYSGEEVTYTTLPNGHRGAVLETFSDRTVVLDLQDNIIVHIRGF